MSTPPQPQARQPGSIRPTPTFVPFAPDAIERSIVERFEQQVLRYPHRHAVKVGATTLTYAALNRRANRIAHTLRARRANPAEPITCLLSQGPSLIAAILGVLKTGTFYVPLDPSYPCARLSSMLEDTQAGLIVTDTAHLTLAATFTSSRHTVVNIDALPTGLSAANLATPIPATALAYVLYTSGSTGNPKGVMQSHRNVLCDIARQTNDLFLCPDDRFAQFYSCSSSAAVSPLFGALLNGAMVLPFDLHTASLERMAAYLREEEITICDLSLMAFRQLASALSDDMQLPKLRLINPGGEQVYKSDVELYKKHFAPHCVLQNALGTTETRTITQYFIDKHTVVDAGVVPVGYAVPGKQVVLLNEAGEEVSCGQVGEIAVKSRYLSPGYWHQPYLTGVAFVGEATGEQERLYRTGDLGRLRHDGCLQHLGRKDFQVKIRGYRVEIAEIESTLLDHPLITEAAVVAQDGGQESKRLVAYVVLIEHAALPLSTMRGFVQERLPDYMVPTLFVVLPVLPRTPNGKVDRLALQHPDPSARPLTRPLTPPRRPLEEMLAQVWAEVLGLDQVGIHDNFFELGGHSLLATQVSARVFNTICLDLPLQCFLQAPTIARLADLLTIRLAEQSADADLVRLLDESAVPPANKPTAE